MMKLKILGRNKKNGGVLWFTDHKYGKWCEWEPYLQCLNVQDSDHFAWIHLLWDFWLDMFFIPVLYHLCSCLSGASGTLRHFLWLSWYFCHPSFYWSLMVGHNMNEYFDEHIFIAAADWLIPKINLTCCHVVLYKKQKITDTIKWYIFVIWIELKWYQQLEYQPLLTTVPTMVAYISGSGTTSNWLYDVLLTHMHSIVILLA